MKLVIYSFLLSLIFYSCQKELGSEATPTVTDSSIFQFPTDTSWQPVSKNSFWIYKANNAAAEITTMTATGITTSISGQSFYVFSVDKTGQASSTAYFSREDNRYELQQIFTRMNMVSPRVYAGFVYLQGNNPRNGDTWEYDAGIASNSYPAKIIGEVQSTTISLTVAGRNFENVLLVKLKVMYKLDAQSGYENFQSYYFYLVKGIGIVRVEALSTGGGPNTFNVTEELIDYRLY